MFALDPIQILKIIMYAENRPKTSKYFWGNTLFYTNAYISKTRRSKCSHLFACCYGNNRMLHATQPSPVYQL